jgi:hypothetical protein
MTCSHTWGPGATRSTCGARRCGKHHCSNARLSDSSRCAEHTKQLSAPTSVPVLPRPRLIITTYVYPRGYSAGGWREAHFLEKRIGGP